MSSLLSLVVIEDEFALFRLEMLITKSGSITGPTNPFFFQLL